MIIADTLPLTAPAASQPDVSAARRLAESGEDAALREVAQDFEAAFIAQMLTHSGLSEALTSGEGSMASAFGTFYVEQLAEQMTESGGIGMAEKIYSRLKQYGEPVDPTLNALLSDEAQP
jgi:Rod binding domain-containing protein